MLQEVKSDDGTVFTEEGGLKYVPSIQDLIFYNLERVGCLHIGMFVSEVEEKNLYFMIGFDYRGKHYTAEIEAWEVFTTSPGSILLLRCPDKSTHFNIRLELPPTK